MSSTRSQNQLCIVTPFHFFVQCSRFILVFAFVSRHIFFKPSVAQVIILVAEWIDTYDIHHWMIFKSSYRKLVWVVLEPKATEFCSDDPLRRIHTTQSAQIL